MTISLIVPCYNEEANLQKGVLDKIGNFISSNPDLIELIIVDDGSTDQSTAIIQKHYLSQNRKFRLIKNRHQGKAFALITGIKKARADWVMFTDIDLATPIEEAGKLIQLADKTNQIIIGSRNSHRQGAPLLRKLMAVGFIIIRDLILNLNGIKDTQCGFKLFNRQTALKIINRLKVFHQLRSASGSSVTAGFDLEFLFVAKKLGLNIIEVPVIWRHVETKNVNFFKDSIETIKDILKIKYFDLKGAYK